MNKKVVLIFFSTILILFLSLWTFTAVQSLRSKSIVVGGSTSVNPFMQRATTIYSDEGKGDIVYNSTGSQAGIVGVENGIYSGGFISKEYKHGMLSNGQKIINFDPTTNFYEQLEQAKNAKNYYVGLKFAIDAIVLIYKPPTWFKNLQNSSNKFRLDIKKNDPTSIFHKMYSNAITWEDLALELNLVNNETKPKTSTSFITFTREDGAGTRTAFSELTGVKDFARSNVVNSNGMMLNQLSTSEGAIGYVSYSFLSGITKESGVEVAGIGDIKLGNPVDNADQSISDFTSWQWNKEDQIYKKTQITNHTIISGDYSFKRPFNVIIKNNNRNKIKILNFFEWLHLANEQNSNEQISEIEKNKVKKIFEEEGLIADVTFLSEDSNKLVKQKHTEVVYD